MDDRNFTQKDAEEWISMIETSGPTLRDQDVYPHIGNWIKRVRPELVLEIGAGQGVCSEKIDFSGTYIGLDPSLHLLDRAKYLYGSTNRRFVEGGAYAVPFSRGTFDAAFSVMVWHLLSDIKKASLELGRVLKPNGKFLIVTTHPEFYKKLRDGYCDVEIEGRRFEGTMLRPPHSHDVLYLHSLEEIQSALTLAGLSISDAISFREQTLLAIEGERSNG